MTRNELSIYFPDTYHFFYPAPDAHPFWQALSDISVNQARQGNTLLPAIERIFSSLHKIDGHYQIEHALYSAQTLQQLLRQLALLQIAYTYRDHNVQIAAVDAGHDLELTVDGQTIAVQMLPFHTFDSLAQSWQQQFAIGSPEDDVTAFLAQAQLNAGSRRPSDAHYTVLAALTHLGQLSHLLPLRRRVDSLASPTDYFGHVAALLLVDEDNGVTVLPLHGNTAIELLLETVGK